MDGLKPHFLSESTLRSSNMAMQSPSWETSVVRVIFTLCRHVLRWTPQEISKFFSLHRFPYLDMGASIFMGYPKYMIYFRENPNMDDLGVPLWIGNHFMDFPQKKTEKCPASHRNSLRTCDTFEAGPPFAVPQRCRSWFVSWIQGWRWANQQNVLVGGWPTPLKNMSQLGWLFPRHGKRKNVPNHQPVFGLNRFVPNRHNLGTSPKNDEVPQKCGLN